MNEEELIKELGDKIIEELEKLNVDDKRKLMNVPMVRFAIPNMDRPLEIEGITIDQDFLSRLEEYVQDEIEMSEFPTVLH